MKCIVIIGNGGREESIRWKLSEETSSTALHVSMLANDDNLKLNENLKEDDLVVVGPEGPIAEGLTDQLVSDGIPVFGPSKLAGRLETSKLWAKQFMERNDIPTAKWSIFNRTIQGMSDAIDLIWHRYLNQQQDFPHIKLTPKFPVVIKEDGLCNGKGVVICKTRDEANNIIPSIFITNKFNSTSNKILIEDFIEGQEASCFVLTDGKDYKILPYCQDYKPVGEGNTGPNTGGMGALCPNTHVTEEVKNRVEKEIIIPTLDGMREEGLPYKGVLYIGLMIKEDGSPYVIEYNVRFGDPECQVLMMLMKSELHPYLEAVANETLGTLPDPEFYEGSALTVVMCSGGYPEEYQTQYMIEGLDAELSNPNVKIFHAGTQQVGNHHGVKWITNGGRVLNVTARGDSLEDAREQAYNVVEKISWQDSFYRSDIGVLRPSTAQLTTDHNWSGGNRHPLRDSRL